MNIIEFDDITTISMSWSQVVRFARSSQQSQEAAVIGAMGYVGWSLGRKVGKVGSMVYKL